MKRFVLWSEIYAPARSWMQRVENHDAFILLSKTPSKWRCTRSLPAKAGATAARPGIRLAATRANTDLIETTFDFNALGIVDETRSSQVLMLQHSTGVDKRTHRQRRRI